MATDPFKITGLIGEREIVSLREKKKRDRDERALKIRLASSLKKKEKLKSAEEKQLKLKRMAKRFVRETGQPEAAWVPVYANLKDGVTVSNILTQLRSGFYKDPSDDPIQGRDSGLEDSSIQQDDALASDMQQSFTTDEGIPQQDIPLDTEADQLPEDTDVPADEPLSDEKSDDTFWSSNIYGGYGLEDEEIEQALPLRYVKSNLEPHSKELLEDASKIIDKVRISLENTTNSADSLYTLAKMIEDNPNVVTIVGSAAGLYSTLKTNINAIASRLGVSMDTPLTESQYLKVTEGMSGLGSTVHQFQAALVRATFAQARVEGQEGRGLSNRDFDIISKSLINSSNPKSVIGNLKRISRESYKKQARQSKFIKKHPIVRRALRDDAIREDIFPSLITAKEFYDSEEGKDFKEVWNWAHSKKYDQPKETKSTGPTIVGETVDESTGITTDKTVEFTASNSDVGKYGIKSDDVGKTIRLIIEVNEQGKATGKFRKEVVGG